MQGSLKNLELPNLIDLIRQGGNDAAIYIQAPKGTATIFLEAGNVVHAEYGALTGKPALRAIFFLQDGNFYVSEQVKTPEKTITEPWNALLLEMLQAMDEIQATQDDNLDDNSSEDKLTKENKHFERLFQESGLGFFAIIGIDGTVHLFFSANQNEINKDIIGSITATLFTSSNKALQELLGGNLESILVEGEYGRIILSTIKSAQFLLAQIPAEENLGIALAWIRTLKEHAHDFANTSI